MKSRLFQSAVAINNAKMTKKEAKSAKQIFRSKIYLSYL